MASDVRETPFVKQLAANDRPTRDKALSSLRIYLLSNHAFTSLELLKLWKGLFFSMWHSDRPIPQQRLAVSLSQLLLPLPISLFLLFLSSFWITISREWTSIDVLRMDKFLRLVRHYVNTSFVYLRAHTWGLELVGQFLQLIEEIPLNVRSTKIPDGLRYHVMDVWVEELWKVDAEDGGSQGCPVDRLMGPVKSLRDDGLTKTVRNRARETLADERLVLIGNELGWGGHDEVVGTEDSSEIYDNDSEEEWSGLVD